MCLTGRTTEKNITECLGSQSIHIILGHFKDFIFPEKENHCKVQTEGGNDLADTVNGLLY